TESVFHSLGLTDRQAANWETGLNFVRLRRKPLVFVSPPVSGWVLAVGEALPYPVDDCEYAEQLAVGAQFDTLMQTLAARFSEVMFFGTDRRCGFTCWVRASGGAVERALCQVDPEVVANRGPQSAAERQLNLIDLGERAPGEEATNYLFDRLEAAQTAEEERVAAGEDRASAQEAVRKLIGDASFSEDHVMAMAAAWSIDPESLDDIDEEGVGLVGVLPEPVGSDTIHG
ncbi:MAG: hypothetical protein JO303_00405, partial [Caulobacteraceae bacterium]|nr:hypothetical protein [Caulobacteraceae bacterium]